MKLYAYAAAASLLLSAATVVAVAAADECSQAMDGYKSAVVDVSSAVRTYALCIAGSDGKHECSGEFSGLLSAHEEFESRADAAPEGVPLNISVACLAEPVAAASRPDSRP